MRVVVVPNTARQEARQCAGEVIRILRENRWETVLKEDLFDERGAFCGAGEDTPEGDLFIAVGGDGTIIHTAKLAAAVDRPILGINAGRLGYTAGLEQKDIPLLPELLSAPRKEERRLILEAVLFSRERKEQRFLALNDAVVSGETAAIISYEMALGGNQGYRYRADGFIVATPTGSTGYSLSAGGPVMQPELDCLVYTPVCPHSLFSRSVVFGGDTRLEVTIPENTSRLFFTVDGEPPTEITPGDRLIFAKSDRCARFLRLGKRDFYDTLNQKITSA